MPTKEKCLAALVILLPGTLRFIGVVFSTILLVPKPAIPWRWLQA